VTGKRREALLSDLTSEEETSPFKKGSTWGSWKGTKGNRAKVRIDMKEKRWERQPGEQKKFFGDFLEKVIYPKG